MEKNVKSYDIIEDQNYFYYIDYLTEEIALSDDKDNFRERINNNIKLEERIAKIGKTSRFKNMLEYYKNKHYQDLLHIIIIPSYNCNFSCSYCYENNSEYIMTTDTLNAIIKYIENNINDYSNLFIEWFGGEPLLYVDLIENFMESVSNICITHNKSLFSHVTTNGYFLNLNTVDRLIKVGVNSYTVTIDGYDDYHNATRFLKNGNPTYNHIIHNMKELHNSNLDFSIRLRCNITGDNTDGIDLLLDYWAKEYKFDDRMNDIDIRAVAKYNDNVSSDVKIISNSRCKEIKDDLINKYMKKGLYDKTMWHFNENGFHICYAAEESSINVSPSGNILKCSIVLEEDERNIVGKINSDGTIDYNDNIFLWNNAEARELNECNQCSHVITCFNSSCPLLNLNGYNECGLEINPLNYLKSLREYVV